ncbi:proline-rich protein 15 [Perognathus longimembris pacificus]|uniref:proline-rich protein 15 n=1 Tax=Perognathus longimembris pacificus TaxID=214514 RepID=UPI00201980DD|nr:proline-rich protein 15 [Perognathus longimembris pacificus]XP_048195566.1 proline-rich protein 15 [Perognathus longimembris pacificus]
MADSGGTGSSSPWWKSLTNTKKKTKESTMGAQAPAPPPTDPELEDPLSPSPDWTSSSQENQHPNVLGGTGETLKPDKLCGEKSGNSRRNLKISRSGRFKEKRKVRATLLPEGDRSPEEADFPVEQQENKQ